MRVSRPLAAIWLALCLVLVAAAPAPRPFVYRILSHQVTDGDTIRTELDLGFRMRFDAAARLSGLDAPELSTPAGQAVKEFVARWCQQQQTLLAESVGQDKYAGRYLAIIHGDAGTLNELLLEKRFAKIYDGKTKTRWAESELMRIEREAKLAAGELEKRAISTARGPLEHWLTLTTGVRHNKGCRYHGQSDGRMCRADEGKPCGVCGG